MGPVHACLSWSCTVAECSLLQACSCCKLLVASAALSTPHTLPHAMPNLLELLMCPAEQASLRVRWQQACRLACAASRLPPDMPRLQVTPKGR
jgi:hypothetical protein